jgi:L-alanine-DL-glutamate epimerase-like enolase superfamily enzyme
VVPYIDSVTTRPGPTTIERVDVFGYDLTYVHGSYVMSSGRVIDRLDSTVVRVTTREGVTGFGEACPLGPTYLEGFSGGARAALRELGPAVLGADVTEPAQVARRMDAALRGHRYAKSAIDVACWDAFGRSVDKSVGSLLGGRARTNLPIYVAVPLGEPEQMAAFVTRERARGIRVFQAKIGDTAARDAERIEAIAAVIGPGDTILADANGGWSRQEAIRFARAVEGMRNVILEQPCATFESCLAVRRLTSLPMVLDEIIVDLDDLVRGIAAEAMDHVNLKVGRVGGLTRARLMRDVAVELGLRLTIEDTWGGDIVTAAVAQLAAGVPGDALCAVSFMNDWTNEHVAGHEPRSSGETGSVPDGPGLGIEVDVDALGAPIATFTDRA